MKLNYECLRKTLMLLEEQLELTDEFGFKSIGIHEIADYPVLSNEFKKNEIAYCIYMLADSGLIKILPECDYVHEIRVQTLTYKGHEFLKQIENETVWNKVKEIIKPIGAFTISVISKVAENVITGIITQSLIS